MQDLGAVKLDLDREIFRAVVPPLTLSLVHSVTVGLVPPSLSLVYCFFLSLLVIVTSQMAYRLTLEAAAFLRNPPLTDKQLIPFKQHLLS